MASCSARGRKESVRAAPFWARVHCGRAGQAAQTGRGKQTWLLSPPQRSRCTSQSVATWPCGQVDRSRLPVNAKDREIVYLAHLRSRKSSGEMMRKLSDTL